MYILATNQSSFVLSPCVRSFVRSLFLRSVFQTVSSLFSFFRSVDRSFVRSSIYSVLPFSPSIQAIGCFVVLFFLHFSKLTSPMVNSKIYFIADKAIHQTWRNTFPREDSTLITHTRIAFFTSQCSNNTDDEMLTWKNLCRTDISISELEWKGGRILPFTLIPGWLFNPPSYLPDPVLRSIKLDLFVNGVGLYRLSLHPNCTFSLEPPCPFSNLIFSIFESMLFVLLWYFKVLFSPLSSSLKQKRMSKNASVELVI